MKLLPAIALTAVSVYLLSKVSFAGNAGRLLYNIAGVTMSMNGMNPVFNINLQVQNPTNQEFDVAAIVGNATLNGQPIGNVAGFTPVSIMPTSQAIVPLTVTVSGLTVIQQVVSIMTGAAGISALVGIVGTVNANGNLLPITVQYQAL